MATYGEYIQYLEEKYGKDIIVLERPIHKEKDMMKAIIRCPKCGTTSVIYYGNDLYGCCNLECEYKWKIPSIVGDYELRLQHRMDMEG